MGNSKSASTDLSSTAAANHIKVSILNITIIFPVFHIQLGFHKPLKKLIAHFQCNVHHVFFTGKSELHLIQVNHRIFNEEVNPYIVRIFIFIILFIIIILIYF